MALIKNNAKVAAQIAFELANPRQNNLANATKSKKSISQSTSNVPVSK